MFQHDAQPGAAIGVLGGLSLLSVAAATCSHQPTQVKHWTAGTTTSVSRAPVSEYVLSPLADAKVIKNADRLRASNQLISALGKTGTGSGFVRPTLQLACLSSDFAATAVARLLAPDVFACLTSACLSRSGRCCSCSHPLESDWAAQRQRAAAFSKAEAPGMLSVDVRGAAW